MRRNPFFHIFNGLSGRTSFRRRLFISFLAITIPILAAMALVSYALTSSSTKQTLIQAQQMQLGQFMSKLSTVYENTESVSRDIILSSDVQQFVTQASDTGTFPDDAAISYTISAMTSDRDYIGSIVITSKNTTLYSTSSAYTDIASFSNIKKKWWYNDMTSGGFSSKWYPYATLTSQSWLSQQTGKIPNQMNSHMLARPIYNVLTPAELVGYVMIYLDDDYMQQLWRDIDWGKTTNLYLLDDDGEILGSNLPLRNYSELINSVGTDPDTSVEKLNGQTFIYSCTDFGLNDWKVCMITPYSELNGTASTVIALLILLIIALIITIALLSRMSSINMSKPISTLSDVMDEYNGTKARADNALVSIYEKRTDEIGGIYRSYKQLQDRVENLISEIYVKNLEKKDAELALLQSQINPHFLYNTLDSINWIALMNDQTEISNMITALSDTFRLSLMKSNGYYVKLVDEIEYVKSYLMLQKFRYSDRLSYNIDMPESCETLEIPRFILQPLVENSLKHGIDKLQNPGEVNISIERTETLNINVANTGVAVDLNKLGELLTYDPNTSELLSFNSGGYGVQNIYRRIKTICGEEYGMSYRIERNRTVCCVTLPIRE